MLPGAILGRSRARAHLDTRPGHGRGLSGGGLGGCARDVRKLRTHDAFWHACAAEAGRVALSGVVVEKGSCSVAVEDYALAAVPGGAPDGAG